MKKAEKIILALAVGVLGFLILRPKRAMASPGDRLPAPPIPPPEGDFDTLPPMLPETSGRYILRRGDSWSAIAKQAYGNYRWWPFLWDSNRRASPGKYDSPESTLEVGAAIVLPSRTPTSSSYRSRIFERADAYTEWYKNKTTSSGRPRPIPLVVRELTPLEEVVS